MTDNWNSRLPQYDPPLKQCPACDSPGMRYADRDFLGNTISLCTQCRTKFMNPQYSDAYLRQYYSSYITPESPARLAWRRLQKESHFDVLARFSRSGRCLCVGCGDGLELRVAKAAGFDVEGYDVDMATTRAVMESVGARVHTGPFAGLNIPNDTYDCLYMDQVLEHLKNPQSYLRTARRLLKPNGILYVGLPNIGSVSCALKTVLGKLGMKNATRGKHYGTRHHHLYFAPRQFANLLRTSYNFEVLSVAGDPPPSRGPLRTRVERQFPVLGSTFILIARKPSKAEPAAYMRE